MIVSHISLLPAVCVFFFLPKTGLADRKLPHYVVNLDLPPIDRWTTIMQDYQQYRSEIRDMVKRVGIPDRALPFLNFLGKMLHGFLDKEMGEELKSISYASGIDVGELTNINLLYDLTAFDRRIKACTSIVAHDSRGRIWHGRNLDFDFVDLLRNMTMWVDFQKGGKTIYSGIGFAYYVNILTGQRPGAFAVSLDERYSGGWYDNLLMAIFTRMKNPAGLVVRKALEHSESYADAVKYLSTVKLIAPSYLIVSGMKRNEGVVITRDRWKAADRWSVLSNDTRWYVIETNYDHWKKPGDDRRYIAEKLLNQIGMNGIDGRSMFSVLSTDKVLNRGTIFSTVMSAASPEVMQQTSVIRST